MIAVSMLTGCAATVKDADQFTGTIPPGMGILAVTVDTTVAIPVLRLKRATDTFAAVPTRRKTTMKYCPIQYSRPPTIS